MAIGVGDILRLAFRWEFDALDDAVNVWHVKFSSMGSIADDQEAMEVIADVLGVWYTPYTDIMNNRYTAADVSGVNVTEDELLPVVPWTADGGSASETLPTQVATLMQFATSTPRHGSRIYLPPPNEGSNVSNTISGALVTILLGMAAELLDGFTDAGTGSAFTRVAYDRDEALARSLETAFIPVTFRTQRRRRVGVGS